MGLPGNLSASLCRLGLVAGYARSPKGVYLGRLMGRLCRRIHFQRSALSRLTKRKGASHLSKEADRPAPFRGTLDQALSAASYTSPQDQSFRAMLDTALRRADQKGMGILLERVLDRLDRLRLSEEKMTDSRIGICSQCGHSISSSAAWGGYPTPTKQLFHWKYQRGANHTLIKTSCGPIKKSRHENKKKRA